MVILAIDPGNYDTKFFDGKTAKKFLSIMTESKPRNLADEKKGSNDIEYEYQGKKGFAGSLALEENVYARTLKGETKVHEEVLLRILLAICLYAKEDDEYSIVVGQPIATHNEDEKKAYIKMVEGPHEIKVNGKWRKFDIKNCRIAAEGVAVGLLPPTESDTVRVIDVGSGTVNVATLRNRKGVSDESDTFEKGYENVKASDEAFAALIVKFATDTWRLFSPGTDKVRLCGSAAHKVFPYIKEKFPHAVIVDDPTYANVKAFYEIATRIYA